jgi:hypothetical protein
MRTVSRIALISLTTFACAAYAAEGRGMTRKQAVAAATEFVEELVEGKYLEAWSRCNDEAAARSSPLSLERNWHIAVQRGRGFVEMVDTRTTVGDDRLTVVVSCQMQEYLMDATVVFGRQGRIACWSFLRASPPYDARPAKYMDYTAFLEISVTIGDDRWKLPATISLPHGEGLFPGLVLVHDSGPQDRNGAVGANAPLRDIARGLASRGIAVLRYDKRTRVYSSTMAAKQIPRTIRQANESVFQHNGCEADSAHD